jgi:hypothetical protein
LAASSRQASQRTADGEKRILADNPGACTEKLGLERATAIVFRSSLQLFVPFALKDARLEDARLASGVRRSKRDRPDPEFEEMKARS